MWTPAVSSLLDALRAQGGHGRPVVFDADGTLWRGDVGEDFLRFGLHQGLFPGRYAVYEARHAVEPARAYAYCVEVLRGVEEAALREAAGRFFEARYRGRVFPFVRPLLAELSAAGFVPWVCSASPAWVVEPGAQALGIPPARVIGVTCPVEGGRLTGEVHAPVPAGPGKVTWLQRRGVTPALAVGNGDLDVDMLAFAARALVVTPPDSENHLVAQARARGWPILMA